jgi:hypothetical protein
MSLVGHETDVPNKTVNRGVNDDRFSLRLTG